MSCLVHSELELDFSLAAGDAFIASSQLIMGHVLKDEINKSKEHFEKKEMILWICNIYDTNSTSLWLPEES